MFTLTLFLSTSVSYPLFEYNSGNDIHLDNVDCNGNESTLSECTHRGIGIHNCYGGFEEAGVICTSEYHLILKKVAVIANNFHRCDL